MDISLAVIGVLTLCIVLSAFFVSIVKEEEDIFYLGLEIAGYPGVVLAILSLVHYFWW